VALSGTSTEASKISLHLVRIYQDGGNDARLTMIFSATKKVDRLHLHETTL
jgi:hypothetical protein